MRDNCSWCISDDNWWFIEMRITLLMCKQISKLLISISGAVRSLYHSQRSCTLDWMRLPCLHVFDAASKLSHFLYALHELLHSELFQEEVCGWEESRLRWSKLRNAGRSKTVFFTQPFRVHIKVNWRVLCASHYESFNLIFLYKCSRQHVVFVVYAVVCQMYLNFVSFCKLLISRRIVKILICKRESEAFSVARNVT